MTGQPILLAFDTATEYCSVALNAPDGLLERTEKLGNAHSECLLPWIDEMLKQAGIALKDIVGILFSAGPGSFTGLRIACGVAQGLGYGSDKKLLPTSSLTAMAFHYKNKGRNIAVLNDARMNECYAAIYRSDEDGFRVCATEHLIKPHEVGEWLTQNDVDCVLGTAVGVYDMAIGVEHLYVHPNAAFMIEWYLNCEEQVKDLWCDPDKAAPVYVRDHVALTINERLQGGKL